MTLLNTRDNREDAKPSPWSQGYAAGLSGQDITCPYDSPAKWGEWMQGCAAGGTDRRADERRAVA